VHAESGAVIVDFHGWAMPLRYGSIPEEHLQVRASAGIFDLCHMGRLEFRGPAAELWVEGLITNELGAMAAGDARYTLIPNEKGGIIDDAIVYRLDDSVLLVVNASNRLGVKEWFEGRRPSGDAEMVDRTFDWAMIAVQGPAAVEIAAPLLGDFQRPIGELRYYQVCRARYSGQPALVARTGYTGEDGVEVFVPAELAERFWREVLAAGGERIRPIGLGARDTLRLEAGMPLYGNELDEGTHPFEARLGFAVKLDKPTPFAGQKALRRLKAESLVRRLQGFRVDGKRVARQGMRIYFGDRQVGSITSGAPSPTLGYPIAMGYLAESAAPAAGDLRVDLRGRREALHIETLPFYSRTRKKPR
jgi:aminomethyltransferase